MNRYIVIIIYLKSHTGKITIFRSTPAERAYNYDVTDCGILIHSIYMENPFFSQIIAKVPVVISDAL